MLILSPDSSFFLNIYFLKKKKKNRPFRSEDKGEFPFFHIIISIAPLLLDRPNHSSGSKVIFHFSFFSFKNYLLIATHKNREKKQI